ncbi:Transposon Tn10 TetC protein [compost metagenome]
MQTRRTNADRRQETRCTLLTAARALFLEKGYAAAATPELVERAGVTRGALYHHFKDKLAVFQGVVEQEAADVAAEIESGSADAQSPLDALLKGGHAYFAAMRIPGRVRLLLLDGPAVLGPEEMRRIDLETGGRELRAGIRNVVGAQSDPAQVNALADLVSAMFDRAALACESGAETRVYEEAIARLLEALIP